MTQPEANPPNFAAISFEEALSSLEQIVHDLEEGKLGLAESLTRYEQGVNLLKQCHQLLEKADRRIEVLTGVDSAGNPVTEVFDHQASLAANAQESQPRGRKSAKQCGKEANLPPARPPGNETTQLDERNSLF